jgi:hypothetical protein
MMGEQEQFAVLKISSEAHDLIGDFTGGVFGHATTQGSKRVVEDSYAHMGVTKQSLVAYIAKLEAQCGITRDITVRF